MMKPEIAVPSGKTVEVKGLWVPPMGFLRQKPVDQVNRFFFRMNYTVYILKSSIDGGYYYGYTADLAVRLARHNEGLVRSTKSRRPLIVHYFEVFETKTEALKRENFFKSIDGYNWLKENNITR